MQQKKHVSEESLHASCSATGLHPENRIGNESDVLKMLKRAYALTKHMLPKCVPLSASPEGEPALVADSVGCSGMRPAVERLRISPRPISTRQLHALPRFHPGPINLVFFQGSYELGNLILRRASRLDAFSAYPSRTWLPSYAPGGTTGTPAVRPSRSSRTKDSPSQISYARDR